MTQETVSQGAVHDGRDASAAQPRLISIIQSSYVPWKGFFDLIGRCDEYVIFDRAQYVKRHWHNRNRIKTANGLECADHSGGLEGPFRTADRSGRNRKAMGGQALAHAGARL